MREVFDVIKIRKVNIIPWSYKIVGIVRIVDLLTKYIF
jgi:hypothetical protein